MATHTDAAHPTSRLGARLPPRGGLAAGAILLMTLLPGCGQTQVAEEHRELILRLATGASTKDQAIIDRAAGEIDRLGASGELADDEKKAFRAIVDAAGAGDWDRAQSLAYALRDGQEPTEEDRQRVENRTLPGMKKPRSRPSGR